MSNHDEIANAALRELANALRAMNLDGETKSFLNEFVFGGQAVPIEDEDAEISEYRPCGYCSGSGFQTSLLGGTLGSCPYCVGLGVERNQF
jgi:hypothetical protein